MKLAIALAFSSAVHAQTVRISSATPSYATGSFSTVSLSAGNLGTGSLSAATLGTLPVTGPSFAGAGGTLGAGGSVAQGKGGPTQGCELACVNVFQPVCGFPPDVSESDLFLGGLGTGGAPTVSTASSGRPGQLTSTASSGRPGTIPLSTSAYPSSFPSFPSASTSLFPSTPSFSSPSTTLSSTTFSSTFPSATSQFPSTTTFPGRRLVQFQPTQIGGTPGMGLPMQSGALSATIGQPSGVGQGAGQQGNARPGGVRMAPITFKNRCQAECSQPSRIVEGPCQGTPDSTLCSMQNSCGRVGYQPVCIDQIEFPNQCVADCQVRLELNDVYPVYPTGRFTAGECQDVCATASCSSDRNCEPWTGPCVDFGCPQYMCRVKDKCQCPDTWAPVCYHGRSFGSQCFANCAGAFFGTTPGLCTLRDPLFPEVQGGVRPIDLTPRVLQVANFTVPCARPDQPTLKCNLVKDGRSTEWKVFVGTILNFPFKLGVNFVIEVVETPNSESDRALLGPYGLLMTRVISRSDQITPQFTPQFTPQIEPTSSCGMFAGCATCTAGACFWRETDAGQVCSAACSPTDKRCAGTFLNVAPPYNKVACPAPPTMVSPTTVSPTTASPTTASPTTVSPTTVFPTPAPTIAPMTPAPATATDALPPSRVLQPKAEVSSTSISVSWSSPRNFVCTAGDFVKVQYQGGKIKNWRPVEGVDPCSTSVKITGLQPATAYNVQLISFKKGTGKGKAGKDIKGGVANLQVQTQA